MILKQPSADIYSEILLGVRQLHESLENVSYKWRIKAWVGLNFNHIIFMYGLVIYVFIFCLFQVKKTFLNCIDGSCDITRAAVAEGIDNFRKTCKYYCVI